MRMARRLLLAFFILPFSLFTGTGCRQRMADQPYYRPYEPSDFFSYKDEYGQVRPGSSARPLSHSVRSPGTAGGATRGTRSMLTSTASGCGSPAR